MTTDKGPMLTRDLEAQRAIKELEHHLAQQLQALGQTVSETAEQTASEIRRVAQSAAKTELAKQKAEVQTIAPLIGRQEQTLDTLERRIAERLKAIKDKFDRVEQELKASYIRDVRTLGSHIFEVLVDEYQNGMERLVLRADFDVFTQLTERFYHRVRGGLRAGLEMATQATNRFVEKRQRFKTSLRDIRVEASSQGVQEFGVPFWVVETRDESGATQVRVLALSRVKRVTDLRSPYAYRITPIDEYAHVGELAARHLPATLQAMAWREVSTQEREDVTAEVARLQGALSGDLKRVLVRALREQPLTVA